MHGSAGVISTTIEGKQRVWCYEKVREKRKNKKKKKGEARRESYRGNGERIKIQR